MQLEEEEKAVYGSWVPKGKDGKMSKILFCLFKKLSSQV